MPISKHSYDNLVRELYYRDLRWTSGVDKDELAQQQLIEYMRQEKQKRKKSNAQHQIRRVLHMIFVG